MHSQHMLRDSLAVHRTFWGRRFRKLLVSCVHKVLLLLLQLLLLPAYFSEGCNSFPGHVNFSSKRTFFQYHPVSEALLSGIGCIVATCCSSFLCVPLKGMIWEYESMKVWEHEGRTLWYYDPMVLWDFAATMLWFYETWYFDSLRLWDYEWKRYYIWPCFAFCLYLINTCIFYRPASFRHVFVKNQSLRFFNLICCLKTVFAYLSRFFRFPFFQAFLITIYIFLFTRLPGDHRTRALQDHRTRGHRNREPGAKELKFLFQALIFFQGTWIFSRERIVTFFPVSSPDLFCLGSQDFPKGLDLGC